MYVIENRQQYVYTGKLLTKNRVHDYTFCGVFGLVRVSATHIRQGPMAMR